jgi:hypothetical protein
MTSLINLDTLGSAQRDIYAYELEPLGRKFQEKSGIDKQCCSSSYSGFV